VTEETASDGGQAPQAKEEGKTLVIPVVDTSSVKICVFLYMI